MSLNLARPRCCLKKTQVGAQMEAWSKECGGDYEVQIFGKRVIVLTGLADIRRMLTIRPSKMRRGLASVGDRLTACLTPFLFVFLPPPLPNTSLLTIFLGQNRMVLMEYGICMGHSPRNEKVFLYDGYIP